MSVHTKGFIAPTLIDNTELQPVQLHHYYIWDPAIAPAVLKVLISTDNALPISTKIYDGFAVGYTFIGDN